MLSTNSVDVSEFLKITSTGIRFASFTEIRDALILKYKSIYGSDIDVSTSSADGVFINNTALLINNILQTMKTMYSNLDVNTASGSYLDILCRLSNITRKGATRSTVSLSVLNNSTSSVTIPASTKLIDSAGNTWSLIDNTDIAIPGSTSVSFSVVCDEYGPIEAPANSITMFAEVTTALASLTITQSNPAIVGTGSESDASLRNRRNKSVGAQGTTVVEALIGELLSLAGIKDVRIEINTEGTSTTTSDGSTFLGHSTYIVLRYVTGVTPNSNDIGRIIFQKLTPGILTNAFNSVTYSSTGENITYNSQSNYESRVAALTGQYNIYWKHAIPIHPNITVTITPLEFFDNGGITSTTDVVAKGELLTIGEAIRDYANELSIGSTITVNEIITQAINADPRVKNKATFICNSATYSGDNKLTYYNYTNIVAKKSGDNYIITLS